MRALILAAGFGTRLGDLSEERPKPLFPVCDVPLIRYAIALLADHGICEVAINLHHRGELIEAELGDGSALGVTIHYSREETILGTGGAIRRLHDFLTEGGRSSFFVVNGKILIDVDLDTVRRLHEARDAAATMVLKETPDARSWGAIEMDDDARVTRIIEQGKPGTHLCMFTGVHLLSPRLVERLPVTGASDSIREAYLPALHDGDRIVGHRLEGYFHEHSTPERYLEGNWNALAGRAPLRYRHRLGPFDGIASSAEVAPTARLLSPYRIAEGAVVGDGASIGPYCVVGRHAMVRAGTTLERTVMWPGSTVEGAHTSAIVTPRGITAIPAAPGYR
jgi:mannose-1-phosphate guanylyltransferase